MPGPIAGMLLSLGVAVTFMLPIGGPYWFIGIAMFYGVGEWQTPTLLGWVAIALLIVSPIFRSLTVQTFVGSLGLFFLLGAWIMFVSASGGLNVWTLITSFPLAVLYVAKLFELARNPPKEGV